MPEERQLANVTGERVAEFDAVLAAAEAWAMDEPSIRAIGMVGSWARGQARMDSDVDLVVLADPPEDLLARDDWYARFGTVTLERSEDFGAIQERRLRLRSGLELEIGIGGPSWANVGPVDPGTRDVVRGGIVVVFDPAGLLGALEQAVAHGSEPAQFECAEAR